MADCRVGRLTLAVKRFLPELKRPISSPQGMPLGSSAFPRTVTASENLSPRVSEVYASQGTRLARKWP